MSFLYSSFFIASLSLFLSFPLFLASSSSHLVSSQEVLTFTTGTAEPELKAFENFPDTRFLAASSLSATSSAFHLHLYTKLSDTANFDTFPVMAAPVCIAYNTTKGIVKVELSLQQLSDWLTGAVPKQVISSNLETTNVITTEDLRFCIAPDSPTSSIILKGMKVRGIAGWTNESKFPDAVLNNPNITFVSTDKEVVVFLKTNNNSVGFVSLGVGAALQCADVKISNYFAKQTLTVAPRLPDKAYTQLVTDAQAATIHSTGTAYPFVGPLLMSVRKVTTCWETRLTKTFDFAVRLFGDSSFYISLVPFGFGEVSPGDRVAILSTIYKTLPCVGYSRVLAGGTTSIRNAMADWIVAYAWTYRIFVDYTFDGSTAGLDSIKQEARHVAASEVVYTALERAAVPKISFIPALSASLSIVFNLPGVATLVLPRCHVAAIFRKEIVRWNDPRIVAANPAIQLPNAAILVVLFAADTGSTSLLSESFERLRAVCPVGTSLIGVLENTILVENATGFADTIRQTSYSIAYMTTDAATDAAFYAASIKDDATGYITNPTVEFVQNALDNATYDPLTDKFTFVNSPSAYPFVGITYYVYDVNPVRFNCSSVRDAYNFAMWSLGGEVARASAVTNGFVPITAKLVARSRARLLASYCKSAPLYPVPAEAALNIPLIAGAGGGGLLLILISLGAFQHWFARRNLKSDKHAVTEPGTTFAIVFTDIQASTTLWSAVPAQMGSALDLHNQIMKDLAEKYCGYVVKTVGDSYVMVYKNPNDALQFALECQLALHRANWGTDELDIVYARLYGDPGSPFNNDELYHNRSDPELFNGLCVRIGLHFGTADIRKEAEVYDYFGNDMNMAARIEACAHGGQIVCSSAFFEEIKNHFAGAFDEAVVSSLGRNQLRGVAEPLELLQILPAVFSRRLFPALRLDNVGNMNDEDDDEDTKDYTDEAAANQDSSGSSTVASDFRGVLHTTTPGGTHGGTVDLSRASSSSQSGTGAVINLSGSTNGGTGQNSTSGSLPPSAVGTQAGGAASSTTASTTTTLASDERFVRFMSHKADADPHGVQKVYSMLKTTLAPFSSADKKKTIINDLVKEWRLPDMRSSAHKQFKQDLGFELYWLIRIAVKVQTVLAVQKQQQQQQQNLRRRSTNSQGDGTSNGVRKKGTSIGAKEETTNSNLVYNYSKSRNSTDGSQDDSRPASNVSGGANVVLVVGVSVEVYSSNNSANGASTSGNQSKSLQSMALSGQDGALKISVEYDAGDFPPHVVNTS